MMWKISEELKKMLAGLAYQNAGDYLTTHEKMQLLGGGVDAPERSASPRDNVVTGPGSRCIALICDGRSLVGALDYAIEASNRQGAVIDLLVHDTAGRANIAALEDRIRTAGIDCRRIPLGTDLVGAITEYIDDHRSLVFLIARPDDAAARVFLQEIIPGRGHRLPVPMVLIEDQAETRMPRQSVA